MSTDPSASAEARPALNRERVLRGAVGLADEHGLEAVTMRSLGQALGVEAMSLYNHVANKEDVLDGMVDLVVREVADAAAEAGSPSSLPDWQRTLRTRILRARDVILDHPWAPEVFASRGRMTPSLLRYFDATLGILLGAGFSLDLAHHALHALGGHVLGFTQELFVTEEGDLGPEVAATVLQQRTVEYPHLSEMMRAMFHDAGSGLGPCDEQAEFEFSLDLILDGLERQRVRSA